MALDEPGQALIQLVDLPGELLDALGQQAPGAGEDRKAGVAESTGGGSDHVMWWALALGADLGGNATERRPSSPSRGLPGRDVAQHS